MASTSCQHCSAVVPKTKLKAHERECSQNPVNSYIPEDKIPEDESSEKDYKNMSIEDLMDDITETEKELVELRQALTKRLEERGLRFSRKEE